MTELLTSLIRVGVIQFGQFSVPERPNTYAPITFNLGLLASYPALLGSLAAEIAPLVQINGLTHMLALPSVIPLATAITLRTGQPLLYPAPADPDFIEGAYDYNVPTVLLTGVLTDGFAERALIKRVKSPGLHVQAIVSMIDLHAGGTIAELDPIGWQTGADIVTTIQNPVLRATVENWLNRSR